jgi:pimeloyl-ACP methyl ester carboxylesterase
MLFRSLNLVLLVTAASLLPCSTLTATPPEMLTATDSIKDFRDDRPDANQCLDRYRWVPTSFPITVQSPQQMTAYDRLVSFPSPHPSGNATNDQVAMEWYFARDAAGNVCRAPAVVVVHESGRDMAVGRLVAQLLCKKKYHTFLLYLPGYGSRRPEKEASLKENFLELVAQGVTDVRRARDAVAVLPHVNADIIAVQGTSLGGFVIADSAALDAAFTHTFIMLAGGDLAGVILRGSKDAAKVRQRLNRDGISDEQIAAIAHEIEPLRIAHRMNGDRTWLFSAVHDQVVPLEHAIKLAKAIPLPKDHHIRLPGNHYSTILFLPAVIERIVTELKHK